MEDGFIRDFCLRIKKQISEIINLKYGCHMGIYNIFFLSKTEFDWTQTVYEHLWDGPVQMLIFCLDWKFKMANTKRQI